jgi:translation initiation factor IF-2
MKKMRVFELAAKLAIDAKDLLKIAKDLAISVENNMSMVDVHDIERIKKRLERESEKQHEEVKVEAFEEERVSSKVIRRRARATTPAESEAAKEEEAPVKMEAPSEAEAETPAVSEPSPKAAPAKERVLKVEAETETPPGPEAPVVEPEPEVIPAAAAEEPAKPVTTAEEEEKKDKKKAKKKGKVEAAAPEVVEEKTARAPVKKAPKFKEKEKEKEVFTQYEIYEDIKPSHGKRAFKGKDRKPLAPVQVKRKIRIGRTITVLNLAREMRVKVSAVTRVLSGLGLSTSENQYLNPEEAILAAGELGFEVEEARDDIKEDYINEPLYDPEDMSPRPPVVTIMGHVDHGKTSLLDAIRSENVTESEFGGITQHIGAYQAHLKDKTISFIDTPGHEAFTSMRARGAQVTDFVVLVVAADDGVMEQTKEAINHARAAQIPIIVAVNKIDKPNANPQRVKEQLSDLGLLPEAWGGDTIFVEVSAKKHLGIEELLEMILLQAEMLDLKAVPKGPARGAVLESKLDKSRGPMSTMLIQSGEFKQGDIFVVGNTWGRVRAMFDFRGAPLQKALPATPVEIIGLTTPPMAGDRFFVVPNEKKAREIVDYLAQEARRQVTMVEPKAQVTLEDLYSQVMEGRLKALNLIIKGDVHGTVEAIVGVIKGLETGEGIRVNVVHYAVGGITENDILLASTTQAVIVGFNVKPDPKSKVVAKHYGIEIKLYTVIYDLIDDIKQSLAGMLEPVYEDVLQGKAEIRSVFKISKIGTIAGCMVLEGKITRNADAKLIRAGDTVYEGKIGSLKRFKDDVREVAGGYECGIGLDGYNDLREGDIVEVYIKEKATP